MKRIYSLIAIFLISFSLGSCGRADSRAAGEAQTLLADAELQIDARSFSDAEETTFKALVKVDDLINRHPDNPDYRFIRARAYFLQFMAKNTLIIEGAEPRPKSLIKMPEAHEYRGYDESILVAINDLAHILNKGIELEDKQEAILYSSLAAFFRLSEEKTESAHQAFEKAFSAYSVWLQRLKREDKKMSPRKIAIQRLNNQVRDLKMSHAELYLLERNWDQALSVLKEAMGGNDPKYFSFQFEKNSEELRELYQKLEEDRKYMKDSREEKLKKKIILAKQKKTLTPLEELARSNPYESAILQLQLELADTQNNLMYRMICLYNLNQKPAFENSRKVLSQFFPELEQKLMQELTK